MERQQRLRRGKEDHGLLKSFTTTGFYLESFLKINLQCESATSGREQLVEIMLFLMALVR